MNISKDQLRLAFSMLRLLKIEDIQARSTPGGRRRYPKTNSFRRQATGPDNIMIASMADRVSLKGLEDILSDAPIHRLDATALLQRRGRR